MNFEQNNKYYYRKIIQERVGKNDFGQNLCFKSLVQNQLNSKDMNATKIEIY